MCVCTSQCQGRGESEGHILRACTVFLFDLQGAQGSQNSELGRCQDGFSDSKEAWRSWNYKITQTHSLVAIHGHSKAMSILDIFTNGSLWFISRIEWHYFTLVGLPSLGSPLTSWTGWVFMDWWIDGSVYYSILIGWFLIGWWTSILWHTLTTDGLSKIPLDSYCWDMWLFFVVCPRLFMLAARCCAFFLLSPSRQIVSYAKRRGPTIPCWAKQAATVHQAAPVLWRSFSSSCFGKMMPLILWSGRTVSSMN